MQQTKLQNSVLCEQNKTTKMTVVTITKCSVELIIVQNINRYTSDDNLRSHGMEFHGDHVDHVLARCGLSSSRHCSDIAFVASVYYSSRV